MHDWRRWRSIFRLLTQRYWIRKGEYYETDTADRYTWNLEK